MQRALELAERGLFTCKPNPGVGCLLVKDDVVIGEGYHQKAGEAHAEVEAIRSASGDTNGSTAFVTLEPCAHHGRTGPCVDALLKAGVANVVIACTDPNPLVAGKGIQRLEQAGVHCRTGLLEDEATKMNAGFLKRMQKGLPYVRLKIAASLDGATALANGVSQWITDSDARADGHRLRARSSAVVTGIGTVLADNPRMTARLEGNVSVIQPLRVVIDSKLRMPLDAQIAAESVLVFTQSDATVPDDCGVDIVRLSGDDNGVDLKAVLSHLATLEVNDVLVEAGAKLSGAFVVQGLVDELIVYQAPKLMGANARGMLDLGELESMQDVIDLELLDETRVGTCWRKTFRINR